MSDLQKEAEKGNIYDLYIYKQSLSIWQKVFG